MQYIINNIYCMQLTDIIKNHSDILAQDGFKGRLDSLNKFKSE